MNQKEYLVKQNESCIVQIREENTKGGLNYRILSIKKIYMQGIWGWSESEGISYQTPILRMKKLHLKRKFKIKKILSQKLAQNISKESYLQEMLGWIESERRSYQILKFIGLA